MRVLDYDESGIVKFYCPKCDFLGEVGISYLLSDNCAIDIDIICELCNDTSILYVLRCTDPTQAKQLSAMLETLKIKREREDKNGY